jgi:hypothetical protein
MKCHIAVKMSLALALFAALLAWSSDAGKPATVKGYVLDSACAFAKGV